MTPGFTAEHSLNGSPAAHRERAGHDRSAAVTPALRPLYTVSCTPSSSGGNDGDGQVGVQHTVCVVTIEGWY